ncbi:MAG TPA: glycoside hydrolase, partial [Blastocatellia bacterium]|nr:glycoside hydrolase [Blastocatellia bacterium]
MNKSLSRREALKTIGSASAVAFTQPATLLAQHTALEIAGKPVELAVSSVSPDTVRLSIAPLVNGQPQPIPNDGSLVQPGWGKPLARITTLPRDRQVRAGNLIVKFAPNPLTIRIEAKDGRLVQQLRPDVQTGNLHFLLDDKPVLGFGEGGPQFDRRGETYTNRNGQGGYRLRTHGGRVPIQWLIGTSGWALFIHHPVGSFDLTGKEG